MASKEYYQKNKNEIKKKCLKYYYEHSDVIKDRARKWYLNNKEKAKANASKNYPKYARKKSLQNSERYRLRRLDLVGLISNGEYKCIRCGFSDVRALQIDHINGGGRKELTNTKFNSIIYYKKHILENIENYQILCANCNWIKRNENQECRTKYKKM